MSSKRRLVEDPTNGLDYNKLSLNRRVSRGVWLVDIARSPYAERSLWNRINVQAEAGLVNSQRDSLSPRERRVKGRM